MIHQEENIFQLQIAGRPLTIGEMVAADYRKADVFRKFGLDYCCGGKKSLEETCLKKGLDPIVVQQELDAVDLQAKGERHDFDSWPLDTLTAHIVAKHHRYVLDALPILYELTAKVARVHGGRHPELVEIAAYFSAVAQELSLHMDKEEGILFPYINKMVAAHRDSAPKPMPVFGSIENPIRMMEAEHESAGGAMEEIRRLSYEFTPPADACTSYRVLFAKLYEFEQDLHQHVHLENNLLFPKAIALEKDRFKA